MLQAIEETLVGPLIPATVLLFLSGLYLVLTLLGAIGGGFDAEGGVDLEGGVDIDGGFDVDGGGGIDGGGEVDGGGEFAAEGFWGGIGAATVRWIHLDRVPIMLWVSTFSIAWWAITYVLWFEIDTRKLTPGGWTMIWISLRNGVIAVFVTRFLTSPLHRLLTPTPQFRAGTLVGGQAEIETSQVDDTFGRARYATGASPLLIRVRTRGETLPKGSTVQLVDYDAVSKEYIVEAFSAPAE